MSRARKLLLTSCVLVAVAALASACGTEKIKVQERSAGTVLYTGAVLFNQRCSGCHTLSYAATHGSATNVRTKQYNNGPNFDIRCERPVTRVLYAIENGGFSGAIMPQNVVVGQQATEVAEFVATYSGRKAPRVPGTVVCDQQPIGTLPGPVSVAATSTTTATTPTTAAKAPATAPAKKPGGKAPPKKKAGRP